MDVELQILKHLKRAPAPTVAIIDRYCDSYNDLFSDVRNYAFPLMFKVFKPRGRLKESDAYQTKIELASSIGK